LAGDLIVLAIGHRTAVGAGAAAYFPSTGWIQAESMVNDTYKSAVWYKVATGLEAGSKFNVVMPNGNVGAVHYLRFSKTDSMHGWRVVSNSGTFGFGSPLSRELTIPSIDILSGGQIMTFDFQNRGSVQDYWLESMAEDGNLLGIPQQVTIGANSSGSSYRRRISLSAVDGLPGVGAGIDGIPTVPDDSEPPTTPTNLRINSISTSTVALQWDPSTDNALVTGYLVYQGSSSVASVSGSTVSYTRSGLKPSSSYSFRVRARDASGNISAFSNQITVKTKALPPPPPPPSSSGGSGSAPPMPVNFTLSGKGQHFIEMRWDQPGGTISGRYGILFAGKRIGSIDSDARSFRWSDLLAGRTYTVGVRAEGDNGKNSSWNYRSITTTPKPKTSTSSSSGSSPKTYTKTWSATWSQSYRQSGSRLSTNDGTEGRIWQGYADSYNGNRRSLIGFNDSSIRSAINGAEIIKVELIIRNISWYWNAGGTIRWGVHKYSSKPGSWSSGNVSIKGSRSMNVGQTVAINITDVGAGFKGTWKGIAIGPGSSTGTNYYGSFYPAGSGSPPKIRFTYRK
jgi:hypothetical protein